MTATIPAPVGASEPLAERTTQFNAYAVASRSGPHVTTQAGVLHAGRFWTTTSDRSLKRRSVETHGVASAVVPDGERDRIVSGRTTAVRLKRPFALTADPTAPLRAPGALLRLGVGQAAQLLGYVEAARLVPSDWLPHRRVLLVTRLDRSITLDGLDIADVSGDWGDEATAGDRLVVEPHVAEDWLRDELPHERLPASHRSVVRLDRRVHLGLSTPAGPVPLPARWLGEDRFVTSAAALVRIGARLPGPSVAVFDRSTSRRPDEKQGVMFRGHATLTDLDGGRATVALRTDRITTWDGFASDTVRIGAVRASR